MRKERPLVPKNAEKYFFARCRFLFRTLLKKREVRLFVVGLFHAFVDVTEMFLFSRIRGKKLCSILLSQTRLFFGTRPYRARSEKESCFRQSYRK